MGRHAQGTGRDLGGQAAILADVRAARARGAGLLVFADYDGTLAPIVPDPASAWLAPAVRRHLGRLALHPGVRVAITSGRALSDLRRRVGLQDLVYVGCHGLEVAGPGLAFTHPAAEGFRHRIETVARTLHRYVDRIPGVLVEPKGLAVALHWRQAPPAAMPRIVDAVNRVRVLSGVAFLSGKQVADIVPDVGWTMADCARWLRDHLFAGCVDPPATLYLGDDFADELAFAALSGTAITVKIGDGVGPTRATHRLRDPDDVEDLLEELAGEP